ncbi:MAG: hypothetical protein JSS07_03710 [Proteobacteria bacterium]|nr:hypothetical protein [Pseudomonadota bacterium]
MTKPFHPSSRIPYIEALTEMAEELACQGSIISEPSLPKTKSTLGIDQILWIQVMMGDEEGMKLTLELGADPNFRHKGTHILNLAQAYQTYYGHNGIHLLESYGAKLPLRKTHQKKSSN